MPIDRFEPRIDWVRDLSEPGIDKVLFETSRLR